MDTVTTKDMYISQPFVSRSVSEHVTSARSTHAQPLPVRGGVAVVVAVLANAALVVGLETLDLAPGFEPLTIPPVVFLSAVGAGGGTFVYWLLSRYVADVDRVFLRVAGAVLLLSFFPDIALLALDPAATVLGVFILMLMHVIVAGVAVGLLVYWGRE